jgi:hypothetical protein
MVHSRQLWPQFSVSAGDHIIVTKPQQTAGPIVKLPLLFATVKLLSKLEKNLQNVAVIKKKATEIRKKVSCSGRLSESKPEDVDSFPDVVTFWDNLTLSKKFDICKKFELVRWLSSKKFEAHTTSISLDMHGDVFQPIPSAERKIYITLWNTAVL